MARRHGRSLPRDPRPEREAKAVAALAQLQREAAKRYVPMYYLALIFTKLGDGDRAFEDLGKAATSTLGM